MLDRFLIFTRTGLVLFSVCWLPAADAAARSDAVSVLVRDALLTSRAAAGGAAAAGGGVNGLEVGDSAVKWCEAQGGLVFAAELNRAVARQVRRRERAPARAIFEAATEANVARVTRSSLKLPSRHIARQYLHFCTSKASKLGYLSSGRKRS
jgi:hypothetical protein